MTESQNDGSRRRVLVGALSLSLAARPPSNVASQGDQAKKESDVAKPSIVFVHGIWADGSSFQKLIPTLRAEGHEVIASQYGLDSLKGDVDAVIRTFARVSAPIVLVGHSYGGTLITPAGMDPRVAALVYIAALAAASDDTS